MPAHTLLSGLCARTVQTIKPRTSATLKATDNDTIRLKSTGAVHVAKDSFTVRRSPDTKLRKTVKSLKLFCLILSYLVKPIINCFSKFYLSKVTSMKNELRVETVTLQLKDALPMCYVAKQINIFYCSYSLK